MKKTITIIVIVLVAVGLGYYLYSLSPQNNQQVSFTTKLDDPKDLQPIQTVPPVDAKADHVLGNPQAKNVLVTYEDFQCPACAAFNPVIKQLVDQEPDTVLVFRYYPIFQIHKNSVIASYAAEAAGEQGKFWEMHDQLFSNQQAWENMIDPRQAFIQYAQTVGVSNIAKFEQDMNSDKYKPYLQQQYNQSIALGVRGTPTFYFNGHELQNQALDGMKKQIEQYLNK